MERAVAKPFADAVLKHADAAARGGQKALDDVLTAHPAFRRA
jgi:hypothetical protein